MDNDTSDVDDERNSNSSPNSASSSRSSDAGSASSSPERRSTEVNPNEQNVPPTEQGPRNIQGPAAKIKRPYRKGGVPKRKTARNGKEPKRRLAAKKGGEPRKRAAPKNKGKEKETTAEAATTSTATEKPTRFFFTEEGWVEPSPVKSYMDWNRIPSVDQRVWTSRVKGYFEKCSFPGNELVDEVGRLFPDRAELDRKNKHRKVGYYYG